MSQKKYSYYIPEHYIMYDMCYCMSEKCIQNCARKKGASGICTVSDFTKSCSDYKEKK